MKKKIKKVDFIEIIKLAKYLKKNGRKENISINGKRK